MARKTKTGTHNQSDPGIWFSHNLLLTLYRFRYIIKSKQPQWKGEMPYDSYFGEWCY